MDILVFESYQIQNLELFTAMHKYINENIIELEDDVSTFNIMLEAKKVKWWEAVKGWFKQIFALIGKLFAAIFLGKKFKITEINKDAQNAIEKLQKEQAESGQITLTSEQQNQLLQNQIKKQNILGQVQQQVQKALPAPSTGLSDAQKNLIDTKFSQYISNVQNFYKQRIQQLSIAKKAGKTPHYSDGNVNKDVQKGIHGFSNDGKSGWAAYCKKMIESLSEHKETIPEVQQQITDIKDEILHSLKIINFDIQRVVATLFILHCEVNMTNNPPVVNDSDLKGVPDKIINYHIKNFIDEINNFYKKLFKIYTNIWTAILILDPLNISKLSKGLTLDKCKPIIDNFKTLIENKFKAFESQHNSTQIDKLYNVLGSPISKSISYFYKHSTDPFFNGYAQADKGLNKICSLSENNFYKCKLSSSTNTKSVINEADIYFTSLTKFRDFNIATKKNKGKIIIDELSISRFLNLMQLSLKNIVDFEYLIMNLLDYCETLLNDPIICV